jgi:hypothetical protein
MSQRLIRTYYSGTHDRTAASCTLEGAIKAAILRLLGGEFTRATIHDTRFGDNVDTHAVTLYFGVRGITIRWKTSGLFPRRPPQAPKRRKTSVALPASPSVH